MIRANSVSWSVAEPRRTAGFRAAVLRRRALVGLLLALERRRIAHPKGLGLRRFSKWHYSRDLRSVKWVSGVSLHDTAHVCFGSKADMGACPRHVRFTPKKQTL